MQRRSTAPRGDSPPHLKKGAPLPSPGRPPKGAQPMSASERSMRRMGRLAGIETAAADMTERLWWLYRDLSDNGLSEWANEVANILKISALRTAAEYTRRNSAYFVQNGPRPLSHVEINERRQEISSVAERIDNLAQDVVNGECTYRQFDQLREELRELGFWIDSAFVSAVARAFHAGIDARALRDRPITAGSC